MAEDVRDLVAAACRILFHEGQEHLYLGHVSGREQPGGDRFWVKPTGLGLGEVQPDDLVLVDLDGRRVAGERPLHHELPIHAEIYRGRPDVNAIVHTHPFHAAALAAADAAFRIVSQDSIPFAAGFGRYGSARLIVTREQGRAVAEALGAQSLVLLRNHGIAVADATIEGAVCLAVAFDRSLRLQVTASLLGNVVEIEPAEVAEMRDYFAASYGDRNRITFAYLRRRAGG